MRSRTATNQIAPAPSDEEEQVAGQPARAFTRRAAVAVTALLLAGWHAPRGAFASSATKVGPMSDPRIKTYETYLAAWSAVPDAERAKLLRECLTEDIVFTNSMQTRRGLADVARHLEAFQQRTPGGSFRLNEMLSWENHVHATWQLVDAQGQPGFWGYDALVYNEKGRIESILMFVRVEKQILK